jgi:hypothetical protein
MDQCLLGGRSSKRGVEDEALTCETLCGIPWQVHVRVRYGGTRTHAGKMSGLAILNWFCKQIGISAMCDQRR